MNNLYDHLAEARPQLREDILAPEHPDEPSYTLPSNARPQLLADIAETQGGLEHTVNDA